MSNLIKTILLLLMLTFLLIINLDVNHRVFGEQYQDYKVVIDAGHGGYDGGAEGNNTKEKDINLQIAIYLKRYLEDLGIKVIMIREADTDFIDGGERNKKRTDLDERIKIINKSDADLFISIHMNAIPDGRWRGSQTFYYPNNDRNKLLAESIQQNLRDVLQNTHRKAKPVKTLYLFKNVNKVGALVECGFLSNHEEEQLLQKPIYQDKVAYAIYLGILDYLSDES